MGGTLSRRFLPLTILFSVMSDDYERGLKKELWLCHKNMGLSMDEIYNMPVRDRKYYIYVHNKEVEKEIERAKSSR